MIDTATRADIHQKTLEFLLSQEGLSHIERCYQSLELPHEDVHTMRDAHLASARAGQLCIANLWMINSNVTRGGQYAGPGLLVCGPQGTEKSETYVEHICKRISDEKWKDTPKRTISKIKKLFADEEFKWGRSRILPLEFTDQYPIYLFDSVISSRSMIGPMVPCIVNPKADAKIFPVPGRVLDQFQIKNPYPAVDELNASFSATFAKNLLPNLFAEDLERGVTEFMLRSPDDVAQILTLLRHDMAEQANEEIPLEKFDVNTFQEGQQLCTIITFPPPKLDGEVLYAIASVGPVENFTPAEISNAKFRYHILERKTHGLEIRRKNGLTYQTLESNSDHNLESFVGYVLNSLGIRQSIHLTHNDNTATQEATLRARASIHSLIQPFLQNQLDEFAIKIPVSDDHGQTEHLWLTNLTYENQNFTGNLDEEPEYLKNVAKGDPYQISLDLITDWKYYRDGLMHGNHTLRAALPNMPAAKANKYQEILAKEVTLRL